MNIQPYFVEILGTPEAGKTSSIQTVTNRLKANGYSVRYIQEAAELVPKQFDKTSIEAHLWIRLHVASEIVLAKVSNIDIVIIDRGIIDALFWNLLFFHKGALTSEQLKDCDNFFSSLNFNPDFVIGLTTSPEEAISRKGKEGKIVTVEFVRNFNKNFLLFMEDIEIPKIIMDTTLLKKDIVADYMYKLIISHYKNRK